MIRYRYRDRAGFSGGGAIVYDPSAQALFDRMSPEPDTTRKTLINTFIVSLKSAGVWDLVSALWVTAAHSQQAANLNWKGTSYTLTPVSSPVFTTDRGYLTDGSSSYIDTNYIPTADPIYNLNSAHLGYYSRTNNAATVGDIGVRLSATANQFIIIGRSTSDASSFRINFGNGGLSVPETNSSGHFIGTRADASNLYSYKNGSLTGTTTSAAAAPFAGKVFMGAVNTNNVAGLFANRQYAAAHVGISLNDTQAAALYSALQTYLTAIGANV